ncbi:hypothetical protein [Amycolatopsis sp. cmx-4-61]|uniref:hypothetical protein n=1 Tax=Amycolatopsis sp. cmx-4-61 TaxID=2790937 RepID=UPI0039796157
MPALPERRHDPRPRDDRWCDVRVQLLLSVREDAWRETAGRRAGIPHDVELTHDVARYLTGQLAGDPVIRQAGARFTALPELGPTAGPGIEGPGMTTAHTAEDLLALASRFTVDRNDAAPGDRAHRPDLVPHVARERGGRWFIQQIGSGGDVCNVASGAFDTDWAFRHAEDRAEYLLDRDAALELAYALPREVLTGDDTTWRWRRRG